MEKFTKDDFTFDRAGGPDGPYIYAMQTGKMVFRFPSVGDDFPNVESNPHFKVALEAYNAGHRDRARTIREALGV